MPLATSKRLLHGAMMLRMLDLLRWCSGLSGLARKLENAIVSRELDELENGSREAAARKDSRRRRF